MSTKKTSISFFGLLTIVFITLKLTNYITWSWWLVLLPMYWPLALAVMIFVIALAVYIAIALLYLLIFHIAYNLKQK